MNERDDPVVAEFRRRRARQFIVLLPVLVVIVFMAMRGEGESLAIGGIPESVVGAASVGIVLAVLVFSLFNWRCPECNRYLGRTINPAYCSKCGARLR